MVLCGLSVGIWFLRRARNKEVAVGERSCHLSLEAECLLSLLNLGRHSLALFVASQLNLG